MHDEHTGDKHIYEIDLHGVNMSQAKIVLDEIFAYVRSDSWIRELHIVVGQGRGSVSGPVLPSFVGNYVQDRGYTFRLENGIILVILM